MAKYWLFLDNQVTGPYEPEELRKLPGFSPEALICPEGRKGTDMGDWQRASLMPELRGSPRLAPQAVATEEEFEGAPSLAPQEELSPLSLPDPNAEEKISSLEMAFGGLHEQVRKDEDDMLNLHRILDDERKSLDHWIRDISGKMSRMEEKVGGSLESSHKEIEDFKRTAEDGRQQLLSKMQEIEQTLSAIGSLKERIESTDSAQKETDALAKSEAQSIDEMKHRIEELQSEISLLRGRAFGIGNGPEGHEPPAAMGNPAGANSPGLQAPAEPPSFSIPTGPETAPEREPQVSGGGAPALGEEGRASGARFEPPAAGDFSLPPFPGETPPQAQPAAGAEPASMEFLQPQNVVPEPASAAPAAVSGPVDIIAPAKAPAKSGKAKSKALLWVGLVLLAAGALFAFEEGLIPLGQNKAPAPAAPPAASAPAPTVSESAAAEDGFKKQAVSMVQNWTLPGGKTVGAILGNMAPTSGNLNPWMAEKVSDGVYQVNFYGSQVQNGPIQNYQFEARLDDQQVIGLNKLAQNLLAPPAPPVRRHRKAKARVRRRKPVIRIRPMKEAKKVSVKSLPGLEEAPSKPQSKNPQGQSAAQSKGQAQDAQLLDNLLKP